MISGAGSSGAAPAGSLPLPPDTAFRDPLLGALWEVLRVAGHPAAALLVPGAVRQHPVEHPAPCSCVRLQAQLQHRAIIMLVVPAWQARC